MEKLLPINGDTRNKAEYDPGLDPDIEQTSVKISVKFKYNLCFS